MSLQMIKNCFDSHVHWLATGASDSRLDLRNLKKPEDIKSLEVKPAYYRGEWLIGFGWDQNLWENQEFPNRKVLDEIFPDIPVALSRVDGHAFWANTLALKKAGILDEQGDLIYKDVEGGKTLLDKEGKPTGVLIDLAMGPVEKVIPKPTSQEVRNFLLNAMRVFNMAGFTHIRDMSCSPTQWNESIHLDESGLLHLAVEQLFDAEDPNHFSKAVELALHAKKNHTPNLKPAGVKVFYDGALGSEGAFLSQDYQSGSGRGLKLLEQEPLKEFIKEAWDKGLDFAIHTIGDEAAHQVALAAHQVWESGKQGKLHLEHVEMMRPETVKILKDLNVSCHLQPCHWLSDKKWIEDKLGPLKEYIFPWKALQDAGIHFDFGSDSPIEEPSLAATLRALTESAFSGVPGLTGDPFEFHSHKDSTWTPNTFTEFEDGKVSRVVFRGNDLF